MADIASTDLTITLTNISIGLDRHHRNIARIAFGNTLLTYPSGGIPLPSGKYFGFSSDTLIFLVLLDTDDANGIVWKYDYDNKKLRGYIQGIVVGAPGSLTLDDFPLDTTAEPLATAVSLSLTNITGAGTKYLGRLVELAAGVAAVPPTVIYAEAVGY